MSLAPMLRSTRGLAQAASAAASAPPRPGQRATPKGGNAAAPSANGVGGGAAGGDLSTKVLPCLVLRRAVPLDCLEGVSLSKQVRALDSLRKQARSWGSHSVGYAWLVAA